LRLPGVYWYTTSVITIRLHADESHESIAVTEDVMVKLPKIRTGLKFSFIFFGQYELVVRPYGHNELFCGEKTIVKQDNERAVMAVEASHAKNHKHLMWRLYHEVKA
jgi:exosome complex RNA-binding protein Rrp42 (RNase PH superfamily)